MGRNTAQAPGQSKEKRRISAHLIKRSVAEMYSATLRFICMQDYGKVFDRYMQIGYDKFKDLLTKVK